LHFKTDPPQSLDPEYQKPDEDDQPNENEPETKFTSRTDADTKISVSEFMSCFDFVRPSSSVIIRPYSNSSSLSSGGSFANGDEDGKHLEKIRPRWVVMYDPDVGFVRRLEVYKTLHKERNLKLYFMVYDNSVEEQRYLSAIRKEKDAFERLIREKSTMAIPIDQDGRIDADPDERIWRALDSRIAGGQRIPSAEANQVIVDVREFRSALPFLLYKRRMNVKPCTLEVGDYVLTPNICVERKSLPDLISSLNSGRLFDQAEAMSLHYKVPVLLIEFAQGKAFGSGLGMDGPSGSGPADDLRSKLVLLSLTFPKLRIIWSSSPAATAEIFEDLKKDQPEPSMEDARALGVKNQESIDTVFSITPSNLIRALPGISAKNHRYVMTKMENMRSFGEATLEELEAVLGTEGARSLHQFMHHDMRKKDAGS
ncbi:hypothetical protein HDV05_007444, partial [Chytridiales sp. JEL 0842]